MCVKLLCTDQLHKKTKLTTKDEQFTHTSTLSLMCNSCMSQMWNRSPTIYFNKSLLSRFKLKNSDFDIVISYCASTNCIQKQFVRQGWTIYIYFNILPHV
jgi:hypothetical protein